MAYHLYQLGRSSLKKLIGNWAKVPKLYPPWLLPLLNMITTTVPNVPSIVSSFSAITITTIGQNHPLLHLFYHKLNYVFSLLLKFITKESSRIVTWNRPSYKPPYPKTRSISWNHPLDVPGLSLVNIGDYYGPYMVWSELLVYGLRRWSPFFFLLVFIAVIIILVFSWVTSLMAILLLMWVCM